MPLRFAVVDWGDGTQRMQGSNFASSALKNHKHECLKDDGGGPATFGDTPEACQEDAIYTTGFFEFTKVYSCSAANTGIPKDADGRCIYKPKVIVMDNWEWCTNGGWGKDEQCNSNNLNTATNPGAKGWVPFRGEIRVTPR